MRVHMFTFLLIGTSYLGISRFYLYALLNVCPIKSNHYILSALVVYILSPNLGVINVHIWLSIIV